MVNPHALLLDRLISWSKCIENVSGNTVVQMSVGKATSGTVLVQLDNSSVMCGCGISAGDRRDGRYGGGRRCRCKEDVVVLEANQRRWSSDVSR